MPITSSPNPSALNPSTLRFGEALPFRPNKLSVQPATKVANAPHLINDIPLYAAKDQVNAIIEIPAGTRAKFEADVKTGQIQHEIKNGKPRYVDYLGYPTMYGFLPQTIGPDDADPLDVLVLGDNRARGSQVAGKVIGAIKMIDGGESDYKYLVVPDDSHFKPVRRLSDLPKGILDILTTWFTHYKRNDSIHMEGQLSAEDAQQHIAEAHQRWMKQHGRVA